MIAGPRRRDGSRIVKGITVLQPYAHLIADGSKPIENRSWYTPYRGPLVIHAGKGRSMIEDASAYRLREAEMVFGAIVAVAELVDCVRPERLPKDLRDNEHANGPFCWVLRNVHRCDPLPYRGAQGLWILPPGTTLANMRPARGGATAGASGENIGDWTA